MSVMRFTDDLRTNVAKIDTDHQQIILQAEKVYNALSNGEGQAVINDSLRFLEGYVIRHFRDEEMLQQKSVYPSFKKHQALHDGFVADIQKLRSRHQQGENSAIIAMDLNRMISEWFFGHIRVMDKDLAKHLRNTQK